MGEHTQDTEHIPRLRLDELLEELQIRIAAVRGTRDRVHSLLEAVLSVGRELDLPQVLRSIAEAATVLVDARYGALGVIGDDEKLAQFLTVGVSEEEIRKIGPYPSGHGILGELIRHPQPLRLAELSGHPASYGFPPNHPPMRSFLGVPIRVHDEVFGNLYLTEKGGGQEFDGEDEAVLSTLAVAAGVAIEKARLYEEARRRELWLQASAEVTRALLSGTDREAVFELIADRAVTNADAALVVVALPVGDSGSVQVTLAVGAGADAVRGVVVPCEGSFLGGAFLAGEPISSSDGRADPRIAGGPMGDAGLGPAVAVPMVAADEVRGVLMLARTPGEEGFTDSDIRPLLGFAGQAALAMELADRRRDAEQIVLLEDRDRIARDLHDLAIQRLFATGMTLQGAQRFVSHAEASERLERAVDDLDATIKIIRSTIFGLRAHSGGESEQGLRVRSTKAIGVAAAALGYSPALRMEGLIDTDVPRAVGDEIVAVLGEALTNVARHAHASAVDVSLVVKNARVTVTVADNGVGMAGDGHRSGLKNLATRAEKLGGGMTLGRPEDGGTRLVWSVPLPSR